MARQELNLGIGKFLAGQKREHLMAKDVRVDGGLQASGVPVVLHNLLDASYRVGAAALRLKEALYQQSCHEAQSTCIPFSGNAL